MKLYLVSPLWFFFPTLQCMYVRAPFLIHPSRCNNPSPKLRPWPPRRPLSISRRRPPLPGDMLRRLPPPPLPLSRLPYRCCTANYTPASYHRASASSLRHRTAAPALLLPHCRLNNMWILYGAIPIASAAHPQSRRRRRQEHTQKPHSFAWRRNWIGGPLISLWIFEAWKRNTMANLNF